MRERSLQSNPQRTHCTLPGKATEIVGFFFLADGLNRHIYDLAPSELGLQPMRVGHLQTAKSSLQN